jgi:molecular chaperone GrpE
MGDDEKKGGPENSAAPGESTGPVEGPPPKAEGGKEASLGDRKNAAKAFYRALYSGEDVVPDDFGIGKNVEKSATAPTGPCPNCARFEAEAKESEKKATENENFYKRIAADFENYRRRNDREREEAVGLGIQKAVESILPALDDLDRAKTSLATVTDTKAVIDSLNLVFARFAKCLDPLGVKTMEVLGEHFDPKFHEPVQEIPTTHYADGAVAQELRRGYMIRDKVIRPALVNVASNESGVIEPLPTSAPVEAQAAPAPVPTPAVQDPEPAAPQVEERSAPAPVEEVKSEPEATNESEVKSESEPKAAETTERADENGVVLSETMSPEKQKAVADQAANKQRAANALERLRKPNPTATAELPAYIPEPLERVTEDPMDPLPKIDPDSNSEVFELDEEEATSDASSKSD